MTKEVSVTIEGFELGLEEAPVISSAAGTYHLHNDRHYIQYEEKAEENKGVIKNTIKIALSQVEMTRRGAVSSKMDFDLNKTTDMIYQTSYGNLFFEVRTSRMLVKETLEQLQVELEYALFSGEAHISDHRTIITVTSAA